MPNKENLKIIDYINKTAKFSHDVAEAKAKGSGREVEEITAKMQKYQQENSKKTATYSDIESAFAYELDTAIQIMANYNRAEDSKILLFANLLKQSNNISNSAYDSLQKQFTAINRDYHILEENNNGK
jgi:histone H3/H4